MRYYEESTTSVWDLDGFRKLQWLGLVPLGIPVLAIVLLVWLGFGKESDTIALVWSVVWIVVGIGLTALCLFLFCFRWPKIVRALLCLFFSGAAYAVLLVSVLAMLLIAPFLRPWPINDTAWREFRPEQRKFKVLLPGQPIVKKMPVPNQIEMTQYELVMRNPSVSFAVGHIDLSEQQLRQVPLRKRFENAIAEMKQKDPSIIVNQTKDIRIQNFFPGQQVTFQKGKENGIIRIYLVHHRFYILAIAGPELEPDSDLVKKFHDSFQVLLPPDDLPDVTQLPGLICYWPLDETSDGKIRDASGKGHVGQVQNGQLVDGVKGKALQFDANTSCSYGMSPQLDFGEQEPFTITGWFRTQQGRGNILTWSDPAGTTLLQIGIRGGTLQTQVYGAGKWPPKGEIRGPQVSDGTWRHFVLTRHRGSWIELFVDGVSIGKMIDQRTGSPIRTTRRLLGDNRFIGELDEICIFNRRLHSNEIAQLAGQSPPPPKESEPDDPLLIEFQAHVGEVTALAFSPDNSKLLTANQQRPHIAELGQVSLWEIKNGEHLLSLKGQAPIRFTPDGTKFLWANTDKGCFQVFDLSKDKVLPMTFPFDDISNRRQPLAMSPDGKQILVRHQGVDRYDLASGRKTATWPELSLFADALDFHPDGKTFVCASAGNLALCRADDGKVLHLQAIDRSFSRPMLTFSPDGKKIGALLSGRSNFSVRNAETGAILTLPGWPNDFPARMDDYLFFPSGRAVACATGSQISVHGDIEGRINCRGSLTSIAVSHDGQLLAAGLRNGWIKIFSTAKSLKLTNKNLEILTSRPVVPPRQDLPPPDSGLAPPRNLPQPGGKLIVKELPEHSFEMGGKRLPLLFFTSDAKKMVVNCNQLTTLIDLTTRKLVRQLTTPSPSGSSADVSPDAQYLAVSRVDLSRRTDLSIVSLTDGQVKSVPGFESKRLAALKFSPNGKSLLVAADEAIWLVALDTLQVKKTPLPELKSIARLAYGPHENQLILHSAFPAVGEERNFCYDLTTGRKLAVFPKLLKSHPFVAQSGDRKRLLFRLPGGVIVHDLASETMIGMYTGNFNNPTLSPDGKNVYLINYQRQLFHWNLETNRVASSPPLPFGLGSAAYYSVPSGKTTIACDSRNGELRLFDIVVDP